MISIRKYRSEDAEALRFVCLNSEGANSDTEETNRFVLTTYCNYYIENEPNNCFVACDETDRVIGYVICAESFTSFYRVFKKQYVPQAEKLGLVRRCMALKSISLQKKFSEMYPAHLHIDVLPEFHRQGIGSKLIDALRTHLQEQNVCGVMLVVGRQNLKGTAFYKKYGFELLEERGDDIAFGLKL